MEHTITRQVKVLDLNNPEHETILQGILNMEGVVCDPSKDIEYFFGDKSGTLMAVVYYSILESKLAERTKTPKEVITEIVHHE